MAKGDLVYGSGGHLLYGTDGHLVYSLPSVNITFVGSIGGLSGGTYTAPRGSYNYVKGYLKAGMYYVAPWWYNYYIFLHYVTGVWWCDIMLSPIVKQSYWTNTSLYGAYVFDHNVGSDVNITAVTVAEVP